jgi:hypothetical protein
MCNNCKCVKKPNYERMWNELTNKIKSWSDKQLIGKLSMDEYMMCKYSIFLIDEVEKKYK